MVKSINPPMEDLGKKLTLGILYLPNKGKKRESKGQGHAN